MTDATDETHTYREALREQILAALRDLYRVEDLRPSTAADAVLALIPAPHPQGGTETWGFGDVSAALLIARTAWPNENDDARQSWSKRLTDPADRALLDQEYQRARARLDSAYALLAAAPAPTEAGEAEVEAARYAALDAGLLPGEAPTEAGAE